MVLKKKKGKCDGPKEKDPRDLEQARRHLMNDQAKVTKYLMNLASNPREALEFIKQTTIKGERRKILEASTIPSKLDMMKEKYTFKDKF